MRASLLAIGCVVALSATTPALAQAADDYIACTKAERGNIIAALERSERLALTAATAVGPTPVFIRWFGKYTPENGEVVRKNLKLIVSAIRNDQITTECVNNGTGLCARDTYAFVNSGGHYHVNLCPNFFQMRTMKELDDESALSGNGTRAGTMIHEISHFNVVAGTDDICYSRDDCAELSVDAPMEALMNADSYQYFVEDVTYYGVAGE